MGSFFGFMGSLLTGKSANNVVQTFIDKEITIKGDIHIGKSGIHIEGQVFGDIHGDPETSCVVISEKGMVQGAIHTGRIILIGHIKGNIRCQHFEIFDQAIIEGNIQYKTLSMHGGRISGTMSPMISSPEIEMSQENLFLASESSETEIKG